MRGQNTSQQPGWEGDESHEGGSVGGQRLSPWEFMAIGELGKEEGSRVAKEWMRSLQFNSRTRKMDKRGSVTSLTGISWVLPSTFLCLQASVKKLSSLVSQQLSAVPLVPRLKPWRNSRRTWNWTSLLVTGPAPHSQGQSPFSPSLYGALLTYLYFSIC